VKGTERSPRPRIILSLFEITATGQNPGSLLYFHIDAVPDLVHRKTCPDGIAFLIKLDFTQRGVHCIGMQGMTDLGIVCGFGFLDRIEDSLGGRIGVQVKRTRFRPVGLLVGLVGGDCQRVFEVSLGPVA